MLPPDVLGLVESEDPRLNELGLGNTGDTLSEEPPEMVAIRLDPLGGCGNEAMLMVFLMLRLVGLLSLLRVVDVVLRVGIDGVEAAWCGLEAALGIVALEGVRMANLDGICEVEGALGTCEGVGRLFRVLIVGRGGNADVGGPNGGCEGSGRVVAIVKVQTSRSRLAPFSVRVK